MSIFRRKLAWRYRPAMYAIRGNVILLRILKVATVIINGLSLTVLRLGQPRLTGACA